MRSPTFSIDHPAVSTPGPKSLPACFLPCFHQNDDMTFPIAHTSSAARDMLILLIFFLPPSVISSGLGRGILLPAHGSAHCCSSSYSSILCWKRGAQLPSAVLIPALFHGIPCCRHTRSLRFQVPQLSLINSLDRKQDSSAVVFHRE